MDDIAQKINDLLSSEEGLNQIKQMADMLGVGSEGGIDLSALSGLFGAAPPPCGEAEAAGNGCGGSAGTPSSGGGTGGLDGLGELFSNIDMSTLIKLMNAYSSGGNNENTKLLLALKPHLSEKRQKRVDDAISLLKLAAIYPLIKESGILSSIFGK